MPAFGPGVPESSHLHSLRGGFRALSRSLPRQRQTFCQTVMVEL